MSWRLLAGDALASRQGDPGLITFFLADSQSQWWDYHEQLMDAGLVDYETHEQRAARYYQHFDSLVLFVNQYNGKAFVTWETEHHLFIAGRQARGDHLRHTWRSPNGGGDPGC